ncbi:Espin-like protein [Myotis davidii]|uniref:Espin-like protein n=1 Tax=Myotis davidii TaxID=225400 RepID=L5M2Z9_MYODS|nr:Espin-like protein [Myotis davidii]
MHLRPFAAAPQTLDQDDSGVSPLHLAARFAHPVLVEWLLREGHAATLETLEGALPLHHAAVSGDLTCLKLLAAAHRSSVNRRTRSGASPLYLACQEGHLHLAQFLVKDCGADVHLRALDGMSALHAAAARGHYSLVVWLVTFTDIGLTARDNEGATALHFAARGGHTPILDRLLLLGAPIMRDSWGGTPLHDAAENGQMECCQTLVSHRVDPSLRDEDGYTAADLAEYHGHQDCAQYLRETARPEDGGSVGPTEQAAWRYSQTHQAILGPFGELLTEDDLVYLEKQIADLQLRRRCQEYESQLGQLAAELQALLPEPLVSITVNSHFLPRAPGLEGEEAPCPVPEPSGPEVAVEAVQGGQPLPFWCSHVARLVRSMSLLLKGMNGLVQGEEKPAVQPPQEASREAPASPPQSEAQREIQECGVSVRTLRGNFESAPCLPCIPNLGPCEAGAPPGQCPRAYWPAPPQPRGSPIGGEPGPGDTEEASDSGISCEEAPSEAGAGHSPDLANLRKERIFLPHVDGAPVPYGSLTLDLFMLGYFQLLECDLPAEERKMRHLLCFEVFEHLGAHGWEAARAFHKAVTDEVASGRRAWTDGFEDIKARFFGSNRGPAWDAEPGRKSGLTPLGPPPHTSSPSGGPEPAAQRLGSSSQRGSFNSEDICGYIDRSFAFWKEKEAEMFSFGD